MFPPSSPLLQLPKSSFHPEKHLPFDKIILVHTSLPPQLPEALLVTEAEALRATKFVKEEDRNAYLYRHHLLRAWLSVWLRQDATEIKFLSNPFGKPCLPDQQLNFNISRSGKQLAFVFAPVQVGIDIECIRPTQQFSGIAKRYFHPEEQKAAREDESFFRIWTRKEAILKAQGTGLIDGLEEINCSADLVVLNGHAYQLHSFRSPDALISVACEHTGTPWEALTFIA